MPIADFTNLNEIRESQAQHLQEKSIDLHAFFDGITLHQRPDIYLHDNDLRLLSKRQDGKKTMPLTMPQVLNANGSTPAYIADFIGLYRNSNDIVCYLALLQKHLGQHSFALNLGANMHAVTLMWDANITCWL